jgi:hypothetical protein
LHKIAKNMQIWQNSNPKILKVVGNNPLTHHIAVNGRLNRIQLQGKQETQNNG